MLTKTFVCEEHQDFGGLGWREKGKQHFEPLKGLAVAHDCLEHFPDDGPEIEHEVQALGASLHVRGLEINNTYHSYERWESLESDMIELFRLYRYQDVKFNTPPRTTKLAADPEDQIDKLMSNLREFLESEMNDEDDDRTTSARLDSFVPKVRGWLRVGYRRAVRRWRLESWQICSVFNRISEKADKYLKIAEDGDEIKVSVDMRNQCATVTHSTYYDLHPEEFEDAS